MACCASHNCAADSTNVRSTTLRSERRAADDLEHVGGGRLLLKRFVAFSGSSVELFFQFGNGCVPAVDILRALGLVARRFFLGFPLPPRRFMSPPQRFTTMANPT